MQNKKIVILITAIGGGGHGEQILKALKLANNPNYRIIGADANPNCLQFKLVDDHCVLPLASDSSYLNRLIELIKQFKVRVLFHGCEPELKLFSKYRDQIEKLGVFLPLNPADVIDLCMDKEKTNRKLIDLGFESPRYLVVTQKSDFDLIDWFPVVVKPSIGGGGSANVYIAQSPKELHALADFIGLENNAIKFVIQEYVGTPEDEFTVGILHDMNGEYINSIAINRLLSGQLNIRMSVTNNTSRSDLGKKLVISSGVSQGYIGRFTQVTEQCKKIAKAIGARGAINIQCRLVDGVVKVFEINPRFSGTTSLRAMVGYNEPDILIRRHLFLEDITKDFEYEEALILRGLAETKLEVTRK